MSMSLRVAMTVTVVLATGVTLLSAVSYASVTSRLRSELDASLLSETRAYADAMTAKSADPAFDLLTASRAYLEQRAGSYSPSTPILLVRLASGRVLSNSDIRLETAPANVGALDPAKARQAFTDVRLSRQAYRAATVPITSADGAVAGVFEAALPVAPTAAISAQLLLVLAITSALVVALGALLSLMAARASLGPLHRAAATADRVTQSRLNERIGYDGPPDEVGTLVSAVNAMLDRLEAAFREQRRFLADASHELRTPLAIVSGHLEILARDDLYDSERSEEIALVTDEVRRMGRLVDDMLSLARLEADLHRPFQPLDLGTLVQDAAGRMRVLGSRRFEVDAPCDLWVLGEPDQLAQAVMNLMGNAVAHSPEDSVVRVNVKGSDRVVTITVADEGEGIRPEDLDRVFDRFYRVPGPRASGSGGSGLGLAIVRRLVELHCGTVTAANAEGGGALFTIELPRIGRPQDEASGGPVSRA